MDAATFGNIWAIMGKELKTYFVSPIAYIFTALMVGVVSLFAMNAAVTSQSPDLRTTFSLTTLFLLFLLPLLTMRLLAEEKRQGSLELLLTSPLRDWEVVVGKFLGSYVLFLLMTSYIWIHALVLNNFIDTKKDVFKLVAFKWNFFELKDMDFGPIISGYVGVLLLGAFLLALGIFLSSLTSNQVIAAVSGIVIGIFLFYMSILQGFFPAATGTGPNIGDFFTYASAGTRFQALATGEIAWRDVIYFLTGAIAFLFFTVRVLESRRYA
ncbi:MAG: ABC transporter permease [Candidatus Dormibacteria bacterium]